METQEIIRKKASEIAPRFRLELEDINRLDSEIIEVINHALPKLIRNRIVDSLNLPKKGGKQPPQPPPEPKAAKPPPAPQIHGINVPAGKS